MSEISMRTVGPLNSGAAVGGAGVATAHAPSTIRINGLLVGIYVKYNHAPPAATTDVTIKTVGGNGTPPSQTILTITDGATDGWFYPQAIRHTAAAAAIADQYGPFPIDDYVDVAIAQADALDNVDVWLLLA